MWKRVIPETLETRTSESRPIVTAAQNADWQQVALNGGPPCFHLAGEKFCLAAQRWAGHPEHHAFVSLVDLLERLPKYDDDDVCRCGDPFDWHAPSGPCSGSQCQCGSFQPRLNDGFERQSDDKPTPPHCHEFAIERAGTCSICGAEWRLVEGGE